MFGPVASGKTFLVRRWIEDQNRVVVFDVTGEFVVNESFCHVYSNPKQFAMLLKQTPYVFRIAYEPGEDLETDFYWCLSALWVTPSDKLLVVDEFHELCPVNATNGDVKKMLRFARHDKLGFLGVSQRIADVHKLFTSCCRLVVLFNTREARDLDAIADRWGAKTATMVNDLRPLLHDDVTGVTHQIPQCVVLELGKAPRIFDFQVDSYVDGTNVTKTEDEELPKDTDLSLSSASDADPVD